MRSDSSPLVRGLLLVVTFLAVSPFSTALAEPCSSDRLPRLFYWIQPPQPCGGDVVTLVVGACGPCVELILAEPYPHVMVEARMDLRTCDPQVCAAETVSVSLGQLSAGHYTVLVPVRATIVREDGSECTVSRLDTVNFDVDLCAPSLLPHVDDIVIGQRVVCITTPCPDLACPGDSIPVFIRGTFPNDCYYVRRVELGGFYDIEGPKLRILIDDLGCTDQVCTPGEFPWRARAMMPPLAPGDYELPIEVAVVTCSNEFPPDSLRHHASTKFQVVSPGNPLCEQPRACFQPWWGGPGGAGPIGECHSGIGPGHPARVAFEVAPRVSLAGIQGDFVLDSPTVRITQIVPTGYAEGMRLQWRPTEHGARFVLFAESGAPIPPYLREDIGNGWPVLEVTLEAAPGVPVPPRTAVVATDLLASDIDGGAVVACDPFPGYPAHAIICSASDCDMNADGVSDVRDLVVMAHCVLGTGPCPAPAADLDCEDDGDVELADVLCCARFIVQGAAHDSVGTRHESGIEVAFGAVSRNGSAYAMPLVVRRADRIGAARLEIAYPLAEFDVVGVDGPAGSEWLELHEVRSGKVVIGLIALAGETEHASDVEVVLRLALRSGREPGGEVRVEAGDFSGRDGVGLDVALGHSALRLGPQAPAVALGAIRPNPFMSTTRFTVTLGASGALEVGVFDLAGREVAIVFRGRAEAGTRELAWNGRCADGSAAANGIYFVRASSAGIVASRRIVRLSGR